MKKLMLVAALAATACGGDDQLIDTGPTPTTTDAPTTTTAQPTPTVEATTTTTEPEPAPVTTVPPYVAPVTRAPRAVATTVPYEAVPSPQGQSTRQGGAPLACIRSYESGGDYGAVSAGGQYRGGYQFDRQTWASVGGSGDPAAASPSEQDLRAQMLYDSRGLAPWPTPAAMCG